MSAPETVKCWACGKLITLKGDARLIRLHRKSARGSTSCEGSGTIALEKPRPPTVAELADLMRPEAS